MYTIVRTVDYLEVICTSRKRGRLKETWLEAVRNDLKALNLTNKFALNQNK